jgi:hypothetical protein
MGDFKFGIWPTEYHVITQHFGVNPQNYAQFGLPGHDGIDIRAPLGSKIFCVAPGEVYRVHENARIHNYGVHVRIAHRDGYRTVYGHLQRALVRKGQIVEVGTVLGTADSTGNSFGTHLHLTLKKEGGSQDEGPDKKRGLWPHDIIDPTPYLLPLIGWKEPAGPHFEGWILHDSLFEYGELAQVNTGGATLYIEAEKHYFLPAGTMVIVVSKRGPYAKIRVPEAAIDAGGHISVVPSPKPPAIMATVDGWAWKRFLLIVGEQAVVGSHGVNVRAGAERSAPNIGMVKAGSTVSLLGKGSGQFLPVRVRRNDFIEPVAIPDPPPLVGKIPPMNGYFGWVLTQYLSPLESRMALTSRFGVNLRNRPDDEGQNMGLVKAFATVRIAGQTSNEYTPVLIRTEDVINVVDSLPDPALPDPLPREKPAPIKPVPDDVTIPGWAFSNGLAIMGNTARVADHGSNLRKDPRRDAKKIGHLPPDSVVVITGPPLGEYTPVRVWEKILKPATADDDDKDPDSIVLGLARIGLHASTDPDISEEEHKEFTALRPGIIKVLSMHGADDIARLAAAHEDAHWIVRAFLSFGGRHISPGQFVNDTIKDVRRALDQLNGRNVIVELHNEPNVTGEGLGSSWSDGEAFEKWWLDLLGKYRRALPDVRFIYPGLSPGSSVTGVKQDHIQFLEASREAVEAADGIGVHLYWSQVYSMRQTLAVLDDFSSRFRDQPIWITEAGRVGPEIPPEKTAEEYLRFWHHLQKRSNVRGVTYFVASASDPDFAAQVWVGRGIADIIGKR